MQTEEQLLCLKCCQTCWWLNTGTVQNLSFHWGCWWLSFLLLNWSDNHFRCRFQFHFEAILGKKKGTTWAFCGQRKVWNLTYRMWQPSYHEVGRYSKIFCAENYCFAKLWLEIFHNMYLTKAKFFLRKENHKFKQILILWRESIFFVLPMLIIFFPLFFPLKEK